MLNELITNEAINLISTNGLLTIFLGHDAPGVRALEDSPRRRNLEVVLAPLKPVISVQKKEVEKSSSVSSGQWTRCVNMKSKAK